MSRLELHSFTDYLEIICVYLCSSALHLRSIYQSKIYAILSSEGADRSPELMV
ncbi:hypothetical protein [Microcoleus sp. PH2017_05_CCC_O_A]|uniref:hypothetical protein n=1 Tax=Microcoleus sp. PH2017_05_CCC_O_A TaxID=2798816 RepID=UPI001D6CB8DF|nr:hypothetical protein [Microcoleus sp. PH2017_05_CCC_O_A]MCC3448376.1 hypothetical protein [Microcoleus sp. PH2017_09_SFU_O_A]